MPYEPGDDRPPRRSYVAAELAVVLATIYLPSAVAHAFRLPGLPPDYIGTHGGASFDIVTKATRIALLLFIMHASGQGLGRFGFRKPGRSDLIAIAVLVLGTLVIVADYRLATLRASADPSRPSEAVAWYSVIALMFSPLYEELVYRAFLITRLRDLSGSWALGILASSALFAWGHRWEGLVAVIQNGAFGLLLALVYVRWRRLLPLVLVHMAYDLVWLAA